MFLSRVTVHVPINFNLSHIQYFMRRCLKFYTTPLQTDFGMTLISLMYSVTITLPTHFPSIASLIF